MEIEHSVMHLHELVLPVMANHHGTLFAGAGLQLMCKAAFMAAREAAQNEMVMAAVNHIAFHLPVPIGATLHLQASVERIGNSSMTVAVHGCIKNQPTHCVLAGSFELVAVDAQGRPISIYSHKQRISS